MASISVAGDTSGSITIAAPNVAGTNTLTLPANTGTVITTASTFAGTGPAFSAYNNSTQSISNGAFTKVTLSSEDFDTNNNFDSSTNYRFTPTIAGYYQVNCTVFAEATTISRIIANPYKNGSSLTRLVDIGVTGSNSAGVTGSIIVYMNGSTDYLELYVYVTGTGSIILNGATDRNCRFSAAMVRSA
jgi:hypothetical protein